MSDERALDWRSVASAVPGGVGVQTGETFAHVSEELAGTLGVDADALVGTNWRAAFDDEAVERLAAAVETARAEGRWEGVVRTDADAPALDLTLSAVDGGAVLWTAEERDPATATDDLTARRRRLFARPEFVRTVLDAIDDVLYVIDEDGQLFLWNETLVETMGYSHRELDEMHPMTLIPEYHHEYVPGLMEVISSIDDRRVDVDMRTKNGETITHEFRGTTFEDPETGEHFRCGLARDVSEQRAREADLQRQLDELATLERITEVLQGMVGQLVETPTRAAVERRVCDQLAASDLYRFAWLGERTPDDEGVAARASAGTVPEDPVPVGHAGDETALANRAVRTTEIQVDVADAAAADDGAGGPSGLAAVAAVPLSNDGAVNGVLVVGTDRENAFSDRELTGLDVLGDTVGLVVDAASRRELLFADAVVELEFHLADADGLLFGTAAALDCRLDLGGYVASGDGWVGYVSVEGASAADVADAVRSDDRVRRARALDDGRVELVAELPLLAAIVASGAVVATATADGDSGRFVVEAPLSVDVRPLVERIQRRFPGATLAAHRERERPVTPVERPGSVLDDLTDRQRETLEAAYRSGYYDWPRGSTAEQVADTLSIAPATLHGHLRKAESKVLSGLFAAADESPVGGLDGGTVHDRDGETIDE